MDFSFFSLKKTTAPDPPRAKRLRTETNRYGVGKTVGNHNDFFTKNLTSTADVSPGESNNDSASTSERILTMSSQNSNDQMFRLLMEKMSGIEDFLVGMSIKLDLLRQSEQKSSERKSKGEFDINKLKEFGLPAQSEADINKLEENLNDKEFKQNLVCDFST